MRYAKLAKFGWKLLIALLLVFGPLIFIGYLYYQSNSCGADAWNCVQFDVVVLGGGVLLFCLPIAFILLLWEIGQIIQKRRAAGADHRPKSLVSELLKDKE